MDFLQSDICKRTIASNELKTHVETGNIYYDNEDTNESISNFFLKQQDPTKGIIDYQFLYSDSYDEYFNWLFEGFDSYQKTKLDALTSKMQNIYFINIMIFLNKTALKLKKLNIAL